MTTLADLEPPYLAALKRVSTAYETLHRLMGPVGPLTGDVPVLTPQQIAAHEEAMAAQKDYEAARDAYWAARTS
jgi:hypothetical protein